MIKIIFMCNILKYFTDVSCQTDKKNLFIITCFIKIVYYSLLITQIDHNLTLRVVNYFHEHSLIKLITWRFLECMIFLKRPAADLYPSLSLGGTHVFRLCAGQHPPGLRTWFFLSFLKKNKKCKLIFLKCIVETKMGSHYIPLTSQFREDPPTMSNSNENNNKTITLSETVK